MIENTHRVPVKTWRKWNSQEQALFNSVFEQMQGLGPELGAHPITVQRKLSAEEWKTISWNAACSAVWALRDELKTEVVTLHRGKVISVDPVKHRKAA